MKVSRAYQSAKGRRLTHPMLHGKAALFDSGQFYVNAFPVDCKPNAEPVVRFRSSSKAGGLRAAVFYLDVFDTSNGSDRPDRGTGLRKAFSGTIKCRQEQ